MINAMKHYYLINNTIKKGSEMPKIDFDIPNTDESFREFVGFEYKAELNNWHSSLQPCEISESELEKIKNKVYTFNNCHADNPIDVTDIVEASVICTATRCDGECIECTNMVLKVKFKQPTEKQVDEYGYIKCGDCNKFYLCTNCGAQCGSEGHFIEPKQVDGEIEAVEFAEWIKSNVEIEWIPKEGWAYFYKQTNGYIAEKYTTKQLYEIFKNRK